MLFVTIITHCRQTGRSSLPIPHSVRGKIGNCKVFLIVANDSLSSWQISRWRAKKISKKALSISSSICGSQFQFIATISHTESVLEPGHCPEIVRVTKTQIIRARIMSSWGRGHVVFILSLYCFHYLIQTLPTIWFEAGHKRRERVNISYAVTGTWECLHCPLCAHQTVMDGWQRGNLFIDSLHQSGWGPGSWLWKNLLTSN